MCVGRERALGRRLTTPGYSPPLWESQRQELEIAAHTTSTREGGETNAPLLASLLHSYIVQGLA